MRTTPNSTDWLEKFIYGLLVICVTSFGTLTYSDAFASDHEHIYHLSLLTPSHVHNPLPPPAAGQIYDIGQWLAHRLNPDLDLFSRGQSPSGLTYFLQSGLSQGYLLTVVQPAPGQYAPLVGRVLPAVSQGDSVWLPPPDKPPIAST